MLACPQESNYEIDPSSSKFLLNLPIIKTSQALFMNFEGTSAYYDLLYLDIHDLNEDRTEKINLAYCQIKNCN
jgi:hypothetical protein